MFLDTYVYNICIYYMCVAPPQSHVLRSDKLAESNNSCNYL